MKILHVVPSYLPAHKHGGPIKSVHNLNKELSNQGIEVTVFTASDEKKDKKIRSKIIDGVRVFYFPTIGNDHQTFSFPLYIALKKHIEDFDLVHITGVWNFPVWAAAFWAKKRNIPYVISPRGSLMDYPLKTSLIKKKIHLGLVGKSILEKAKLIHFTTQMELIQYQKRGFQGKEVIVIPNGIYVSNKKDLENKNKKIQIKRKYKIPEEAQVVLFLGRLHPIKGIDLLLSSFTEVRGISSNAFLLIVGPSVDEKYKLQIEDLVKKLKIVDRVIFLGLVVGEEKSAIYQISDIFAHPSYSENFGMSIIEAMSFGLPVITTREVGVASEVDENKTGLVINRNKNELTNAIISLLDDPEKRKEMGEKGRKLVEEKFTMEATIHEWLKAYNEVIKMHNS